MPQNEVNQYNEVDNDNTDITGTTVVENTMYPGMVNDALRKLMGALKRTFRTDLFRLRDNTNQTKQVAFSLSGLTTATTRTLTVQDRSGTIALTNSTDTRRNRVVNHDMRISQENGTTSGTGNGFYPVDQWAQYRVTSAGVLTVQQVASMTPAGSPNRLRATVTTPDAALAAGEYWVLSQNIEGSNVADFRYGSASAVASVARFGFRGPAGTYAAHIGNSAANRSYVAMFTIAGGQANTDTVQTFAIPGDTTGTWLTADGVIGLTLDVVLAAGSASQGVAGWQAGNILATSAISNGMGTGGAVFELFDVGLRLDPDATGVYGQYEVGEVHPVYRSERYAEKSYEAGVAPGTSTTVAASIGGHYYNTSAPSSGKGAVLISFNTRKAKAPTSAIWSSQGTANSVFDGAERAATLSNPSTRGFIVEYAGNGGNLGLVHFISLARLS